MLSMFSSPQNIFHVFMPNKANIQSLRTERFPQFHASYNRTKSAYRTLSTVSCQLKPYKVCVQNTFHILIPNRTVQHLHTEHFPHFHAKLCLCSGFPLIKSEETLCLQESNGAGGAQSFPQGSIVSNSGYCPTLRHRANRLLPGCGWNAPGPQEAMTCQQRLGLPSALSWQAVRSLLHVWPPSCSARRSGSLSPERGGSDGGLGVGIRHFCCLASPGSTF